CATSRAIRCASSAGLEVVERSKVERGTDREPATTCTGMPSFHEKVVRSISCRRTISFRLFPSASTFSRPDKRSDHGTKYETLPGCSCSRNHRRCWANVVGKTYVPDVPKETWAD